jgi:5'-AMP-activated protein kinase catalytic alpha subunit
MTDRNKFTLEKVGSYIVHETIGSGSFGEVKRIVHRETGDEFAMKILAIDRIKENNLVDQVKREISILKQLNHPNIVALKEVLKNKRHMFLITELIKNGDLFDRLALQHKFPESQSRDLFRQMLTAVAYCHARGICHRDLKLENILLTEDMQVKIADFGFSNAFWLDGLENEITLKTLCGTSNYLPAEILRHESYLGSQVDVWCLGIILYAMVAGKLPFDEEDNELLFASIVKGEYIMPSTFSAPLQDLIRNILNVDPKKRLTITKIFMHSWMQSDDDIIPHTVVAEDDYSDIASQATMVMRR